MSVEDERGFREDRGAGLIPDWLDPDSELGKTVAESEIKKRREANQFIDFHDFYKGQRNQRAFEGRMRDELERSRQLHGPQNSPHESYGIILEELDEFWDEVKKKNPDKQNMLEELVQIAAMCQRAAEDLDLL